MKIRRFEIKGLFRYLNYRIDLNENLNVIHGINGQGKTTILNILTNIFNGDMKKLYNLSFQEIKVILYDGNNFRIYRQKNDDKNIIYLDYNYNNEEVSQRDVRNSNSVKAFLKRFSISPLYLPAQRVSLQEIYIEDEYSFRRQRYFYERNSVEKENNFIPMTKMLDVMSIPRDIVERVRQFSMRTGRLFANQDNRLFETFFTKLLIEGNEDNLDTENIVDKVDEIKNAKDLYYNDYKNIFQQTKILDKIEETITNSNKLSKEIDLFLNVYLENIISKNTIVERYIKSFTNFESIINELYIGKKVSINLNGSIKNIFKIITDANDEIRVDNLSSGEKNLLLIFYHYFFQLEKRTLFMIDEPELSLHIDWQKHILKYFIEYSKDNQIIVVTHSPDILQGYRESEINLEKCRNKNDENN